MKTNLIDFARLHAGARFPTRLKAAVVAFALSLTAAHAQLPSPWVTADIGTTGATGSATYNTGTFTVQGAGAEVYGTVDAFRYVYQSMSGDFTIIARVATEQNTSQWAKVGVMVRESTANNAAYSFVFITPDQTGTDNGILFESRASTGASATQTANLPGFIAPYWLRLVRTGNTFTAARSTDGSAWTTVGSHAITMTASVQVGLVVCSHVAGTLNTSTFTNVSVSNGLPSPWSTWDLGTPQVIGSSSFSGSTFTVAGSGDNLYNTSDSFRFTYQPMTTDCTVSARVATETNTNQYAKAGVMVRQSLTANSAYAFVLLTPDQAGTDRGVLFEARASAGASATQPGNNPGPIPPYWVKLVRTGSTFTAFMSSDGTTWASAGSSTTVSMTGTVYVGLAVCASSTTAGALNTSTFTNVSATAGDTTPPTVSVTAPASGAFLRGNAVTVSATASDNVGVAGVQFKLDGANLGAEDTVTPFTITWDTTTATNGAHTLTAVARDAANNTTTSAGVPVTVDNAAPTVSISAPTNGATVSGSAVAVSATASDNVGVVGVQFKLDGGNLQAEDTVSPFAITWDTTLATNGSHSLTATARDAAGNSTTSTAVSVTVSNSLPPGWTAGDIGAVGAAGSTNYSAGTYIIDGSGVNIWNTADEFQFARQAITGDYTVTARVMGVENTNQWAKAGVMIRETTAADSKYVLVLMTPANGLLFESRATTAGSSTQAGAVATIDPPQWVKLVRTGNSFAASYSADGSNWTAVPGSPVTVSMSTNALAGLAVSSLADGTLCTATFESVSVTAGGGGGGAGLKSAFPRLGSHDIGDKHYDLASYQGKIAKFDFSLLGFYKGWHGGTTAMRTAVQQIKALNPSILIGNYTIIESMYWDQSDPNNSAMIDLINALYAGTGPTGHGGSWTPNDWWAHTFTGAQIHESGYPTTSLVNITQFTTPDINGDRFTQWAAKYNNTEFFTPIPEIDVWYSDNAFWSPRDDVDWDRSSNSANDSKTNSTVRAYYRAGMATYWAKANELKPNLIIMGNVDGDSGQNAGSLREPEYQFKLGGALQESAMGKSFSEEVWSGWDNMMKSYRSLNDNTAAPHLVIFDTKATPNGKCFEPVANQSWYGGGAAYAFLRYAFASALMENGYFAVKNGGYSEASYVWFDEFDRAGATNTSWLGAAIDGPQRTPYQGGVYFRRFQNGAALVNPRSNPGTSTNSRSAVDVTIPTSLGLYKRFLGTQDSTTNNGQNLPLNGSGVPHISINAGDGIILMTQ